MWKSDDNMRTGITFFLESTLSTFSSFLFVWLVWVWFSFLLPNQVTLAYHRTTLIFYHALVSWVTSRPRNETCLQLFSGLENYQSRMVCIPQALFPSLFEMFTSSVSVTNSSYFLLTPSSYPAINLGRLKGRLGQQHTKDIIKDLTVWVIEFHCLWKFPGTIYY